MARNASPRDARAGFDIFTRAGGDISLDQLNHRLFLSGYGPVAQRSYDHYKSLLEAGYNRYVPINRFDIARASRPYDDAGASARYRYETVDTGVELLLAKGSKLFEVHGRATEIGETGCIIRLLDREYIDGILKLKPSVGDMVSIRFLESARTASAVMTDIDMTGTPATLELEYSTLISLADLGSALPLPRARAGFRLVSTVDDRQPIDVVGRRLYLFFELLEEVRGFINVAGSEDGNPRFAEPILLESLSVASPPTFVFDVAETIWALLGVGAVGATLRIAGQIPSWRKDWIEGTGAKLDNDMKRLKVAEAERRLEQQRAHDELVAEAVHVARSIFPDADAASLNRIAEQRLVPAVDRLGRSGVTGIELFEPETD